MDRYRLLTDCLKGFEINCQVVVVKHPDTKKLVCMKDLGLNNPAPFFDADVIDLIPVWFAKIEEKPKNIYVYCRNEGNNDSWIYTEKYRFNYPNVKNDTMAVFPTKGLFGKKIQKYKLVPVNDDDI